MNIIAQMQEYKINTILTNNTDDFTGIGNIEVLSPTAFLELV